MTKQTEQTKKPTTRKTVTYKVKKHVTRRLIKPQLDVAVLIKPTGLIYQSKEIKVDNTDKAKAEKKKDPPFLMSCVDLESVDNLDDAEIIVPAVFKSSLEDAFPDGGYIGKLFSVTKLKKEAGKDYHNYVIAEIELES